MLNTLKGIIKWNMGHTGGHSRSRGGPSGYTCRISRRGALAPPPRPQVAANPQHRTSRCHRIPAGCGGKRGHILRADGQGLDKNCGNQDPPNAGKRRRLERGAAVRAAPPLPLPRSRGRGDLCSDGSRGVAARSIGAAGARSPPSTRAAPLPARASRPAHRGRFAARPTLDACSRPVVSVRHARELVSIGDGRPAGGAEQPGREQAAGRAAQWGRSCAGDEERRAGPQPRRRAR